MEKNMQKLYLVVSVLLSLAILSYMIYFSYVEIPAKEGNAELEEETKQTVEEIAGNAQNEGGHSAEKDEESRMDSLKKIREENNCIVVLDAGHGGADGGITVGDLREKEVALSVVLAAGELLTKEGIKVLFTREADEFVKEEERVALANDCNADYFISIHMAWDEDSSLYGMTAKYNDTYFIPDFNSADLSYLLLEKVASSSNEKVLGMEADMEEKVVCEAQVPVAFLEIGYLSNAQERKLLGHEDYMMRIAEGICEGILEAEAVKREKQ